LCVSQVQTIISVVC